MAKKYLLYIDILGFSQLVEADMKRIRELYTIIDQLNAHGHQIFKTIVFSDTILVYNKSEPENDHGHRYIVMYSIEFAQDLLYRLIGKDMYFRGILSYGDFNHARLNNVDAFFGHALIKSYNDEKNIPGIGLFLHNSCWEMNDKFHTAEFSDQYKFVFLNRTLDSMWSMVRPDVPLSIPADLFHQLDGEWEIAQDVVFLKGIHKNMTEHSNPIVRTKYLTTWQLYRTRFGPILDALEKANFDPKVLVPGLDWTEPMKRALDGE